MNFFLSFAIFKIDIEWNIYFEKTLKLSVENKKGRGVRNPLPPI